MRDDGIRRPQGVHAALEVLHHLAFMRAFMRACVCVRARAFQCRRKLKLLGNMQNTCEGCKCSKDLRASQRVGGKWEKERGQGDKEEEETGEGLRSHHRFAKRTDGNIYTIHE